MKSTTKKLIAAVIAIAGTTVAAAGPAGATWIWF